MKDKLNFRVVEKPEEPIYDHIRGVIKETGTINISEFWRKYKKDYSRHTVTKKVKEVCSELGLNKDDVTCNVKVNPKYYFYSSTDDNWKVQKGYRENNKVWSCKSYGQYATEEEAKMIVEKLKLVDWNKEELPRIKKEVKMELSP